MSNVSKEYILVHLMQKTDSPISPLNLISHMVSGVLEGGPNLLLLYLQYQTLQYLRD